jgi:hypothetical protein
MSPLGSAETSVRGYHCTLRNVPEERRSHLHRGGSPGPENFALDQRLKYKFYVFDKGRFILRLILSTERVSRYTYFLLGCCIPAVSPWRTYRRCCCRVRAEFEPRLRSGHEGLLALTITRYTRYIEFIVSEYWMYREGENTGGR